MAGAEGGTARTIGDEVGVRAPGSLCEGLQGLGSLGEGIMRTL